MKKIFLIIIFFVFLIAVNIVNAGITDKLEAVWTFDNYGNDSIFKHNLTPITTLSYVPGINGNAVDLNGSNQYYTLANKFIGNYSNMSLSFWLYGHTYNSDDYVFEWGSSVSSSQTFGFYNAGPDTWYCWFGDNSDGGSYGYNPAVNTWLHIVIVYGGGGSTTVYFNSTARISSGGTINPMTMTTEAQYIGTMGNTAITRYWDGLIDEFYIWNRSLNTTEIDQLYARTGDSFWSDWNETFSPSVNFTSNTTQTGIYNQDWIFIQIINLTTPTNTNVTLWMNNSLIYSVFVNGTFPYLFPFGINRSVLPNGNYTLNATNTTQSYNIILDTVNPTIVTNFIDGKTFFQNNITGQFNFSDTNLFSWNVSIDGTTIDNATNVSYTSYIYNLSKAPSTFSKGLHNLSVTVKDGHTSNAIQDMQIQKKTDLYFQSAELIFNTEDKNQINIKSLDSQFGDSFDTVKESDRYTFDFVTSQKLESYSFEVLTKEKGFIINKPETEYKTWIVSGNNWIDFYGDSFDNKKIEIRQEDKDGYKFLVTVYPKTDSGILKFQSVGELNIITSNYTFYIGGINITSPANNSFNYGKYVNFTVNISVGNDLQSVWYSNDSGINNYSIYGLCYQETANVSTPCGGLNTGKYNWTSNWIDPEKTFDGDWATFGKSTSGTESLYINYSKPYGTNQAIWQIEQDQGYFNFSIATIASSCFSQNPIQIRIDSVENLNRLYLFCYDGSNFIYINNNKIFQSTLFLGWQVFEEAMYWNFSNVIPTNITDIYFPNDGLNSMSVYLGTTSGANDSSSIVLTTNKIKTNISAINLFDNTTVTNYTITDNFNDNYNFTNASNFLLLIPGNHTLTFSKSGYFSQTKTINITTDLLQQINFTTYQSYAHIYVYQLKTLATISNANITLNSSTYGLIYNNGAGGAVNLYLNATTYNVSISSPGNPVYNSTLTILAGEDKNFYFYIPYISTINLMDEKTLLPFSNLTGINVTETIYCSQNLTYTIIINDTIESIPINCTYGKVIFNLDFNTPGNSYFRSFLQSPTSSVNTSYYFIDLRTSTAIENNFLLDDLLGKYINPSVWIYKSHGTENIMITSGYLDVTRQFPAYLLYNSEYYIEIHSDNQPTFIFGTYPAIAAGQVSLKLYDISLAPVPSGFDADVSYNIGSVQSDGLGGKNIVSTYYDSKNLTSSITLTFYDKNYSGTIISQVTTSDNNFNSAVALLSGYYLDDIIGKIDITRSGKRYTYGGQVQYRNTTNTIIANLESVVDPALINWIIIILISVIALTFTIRTSSWGALILVGIAALFMVLNLLVIKNSAGQTIGWVILGIAGAFAFISFMKEKSDEAV